MPLAKKWVLEFYLEHEHIAINDLQILCCNCHRIKSIENGDLGRRKTPDMGIKVKLEEFRRRNLKNMDWYT